MLLQRRSRLEFISDFKNVYIRQGINGYFVNFIPPKWKDIMWLGTFNTTREAGYAHDVLEFYNIYDFEYNFLELEGTFPLFPIHL
jgi:hypothetical protein